MLKWLIEHWNDTKWSIVPSPNIGSDNNRLLGVAAVSASNVRAVGDHFNLSSGEAQTLTLRYS